jgi:ribosome-associated translation inhibitor RaiA
MKGSGGDVMTEPRVAAVADMRTVVRGDIPATAVSEAEKKIRAVTRYASEPVLHARIRLTRSGDPARELPVIIQVNLDVNGRLVRAQVAARSAHEAIDLVHDRVRRRLEGLARDWQARRGGMPTAEPHEWRHGRQPARHPDHYPRPAEDRQVVRHKTYELATATPDEAAFDMDLMDYEFHLFTDAGCGRDAVVYRAGPTGYRLAFVGGPPAHLATPTAVPVTVSSRPPPPLSLAEAINQLNGTGRPFLFFADPGSGRGRVLYRRYDGHYGLIIPAR